MPVGASLRSNNFNNIIERCEHLRAVSDYNSLDSLSTVLIKESHESGNKRAFAYGYLYKGLSNLFNGHGTRAQSLLDKAWKYSREAGNDSLGAMTMNAHGIYYAMYENNSFLAQHAFFRSLNLAQSSGYESLKIRVYGNLLILSKSNMDKSTFSYAKKIYNYGLKHNDFEQTFMGAYYLALYYKLKGNINIAMQYVNEALRLYRQHNYADVSSVYTLYSEIEVAGGNLQYALELAQKGKSMAEKYNQISLLPDALLQMALVYNAMGKYTQSNAIAYKVLEVSNDYSLTNKRIECFRLMAENYGKLGDRYQEINYLKKAMTGMDTLSSLNMQRLLREREMLDKVQQHEQQAEQKRLQLRDQQRLMIMLAIIVAVLLLSLIIVFRVLHLRNVLIKRIVKQNVKALEWQENAQKRIRELENNQQPEMPLPSKTEKQPATLLNDDNRKQQLYDRACKLMETDKPYRTPQLTREKLAAMLGTNRTYLSTVIREVGGMNYQQFVNSYRIEEAVRILSDKSTADYPMKQLWSDLGFTSASTFYKLFNQSVGITPSVYRKNILEM